MKLKQNPGQRPSILTWSTLFLPLADCIITPFCFNVSFAGAASNPIKYDSANQSDWSGAEQTEIFAADLMALHGSVAAFAHPAAVATAAAAIKQSNALVTSVDVIAMPEDSDVTQAAAANLSGKPAVDAILTFSEKTEQLSAELSALSPFLKAGGVLQVFVPNVQAETKVKSA